MEDETILTGREAQRRIVDSAIFVSDRVRSTLGPLGMDKMLTDRLGNRTLTNDGASILKALPTTDPIALEMIGIAKAQEQKAFDGTTSVIIKSAEMLKNADLLIDENVHPTKITKGYREGMNIAVATAEAKAVEYDPYEAAKKVATTAMTGKLQVAIQNSLQISALEPQIVQNHRISKSRAKRRLERYRTHRWGRSNQRTLLIRYANQS